MYTNEVKKMLKEIHDVATHYVGEGVDVTLFQQGKIKCIRITIPDQTILDIEFHRKSQSNTEKCDSK